MQSKVFFKTENDALDTTTKKLRDYYAPIISEKKHSLQAKDKS